MKRFLAIFIALTMVFSLTSCMDIQVTVPNKANQGQSETLDVQQNDIDLNDGFLVNDGNSNTPEPDVLSDNPAEWTLKQIVEQYKLAAGKTHNSVTSYQQMTMRKNSLVAIGTNDKPIADSLVSFSEGVMATALSNNSMNIQGITGGHQNLVASDVAGAKAYKSGNNIVIEMLMKEQTDHGDGKMYEGTVGHAISVVGDIDSVIGQFSGLGMEAKIADKDCTLQYVTPVVKVTINSNGVIINGTWSYVVNITLNNLEIKAMGLTVPVKKATSIVDFYVILNGGFKA